MHEALEALEGGDTETAEHELEEFLKTATGNTKGQAEQALEHLQARELYEAEDILAAILGEGVREG